MGLNLWKKNRRKTKSTNYKVIIYQSELDYLSKCILESPYVETGGNLFGLTTPFGIPFIQYVVGPGPHAQHHREHFRQDYDFLDKTADCLVEEHALHHIGSWHSHHTLGLTVPSGGDSRSTIEGIQECGLHHFILIIGNIENGSSSVRPYLYNAEGRCELLQWVVLPNISPIRTVFDSSHQEFVYIPSGIANMNPLDVCSLIENKPQQSKNIDYPDGYWLQDKENRITFSQIIKTLNADFDNVKIFQTEDKTIEIQLVRGAQVLKIHFGSNFPIEAPKLYAMKGCPIHTNQDYEWDYLKTNDILTSVYNLINSISFQYDFTREVKD